MRLRRFERTESPSVPELDLSWHWDLTNNSVLLRLSIITRKNHHAKWTFAKRKIRTPILKNLEILKFKVTRSWIEKIINFYYKKFLLKFVKFCKILLNYDKKFSIFIIKNLSKKNSIYLVKKLEKPFLLNYVLRKCLFCH